MHDQSRMQLTVYRYDELERVRQAEFYGTNHATDNADDFDLDLAAEPSVSSGSVLVTKTVYGDDGAVRDTVASDGSVTRSLYDDAGRVVASIVNFTDGSLAEEVRDHDVYTRSVYAGGLQTKVWVDLDGDGVVDGGDQVTEYVYGTEKVGTPGQAGTGDPVESEIATGHLLHHVVYPPGTFTAPEDRTVTYAYNAQGEQVGRRRVRVQALVDARRVSKTLGKNSTGPAFGRAGYLLEIAGAGFEPATSGL